MLTKTVLASLLVSVLCAAAVGWQKPRAAFVCNLNALTAAQRERVVQLGREVRSLVQEVKELKGGYRLRFTDSRRMLRPVAEWVDLESRCCSAVEFTIKTCGEDNVLIVELGGPKDIKPFIKQEFGF